MLDNNDLKFGTRATIVVPVLNEAGNIAPLVKRLNSVLIDYVTEILFVDDSRDMATANEILLAANQHSSASFSVRLLHRTGSQRHGGLSGAVTDGIQQASYNTVIIMDGDLQHPPEVVPSMLAQSLHTDIVVASRYRAGGSNDGLDGLWRQIVSRGSGRLAKLFFPLRLKNVTDPMSGFFLINRTKVDTGKLRPHGFKILLEILATHPRLSVSEVPLQFHARETGTSNGSLKQGSIFLGQLVRLRFGNRTLRSEGRVAGFLVVMTALVLVFALYGTTWGYLIFPIMVAILSLVLLIHSSLEVWRTAYTYRMPETAEQLKFPVPTDSKEHFCLLVPARHEAAVLGETLRQLARQTHPSAAIITIICDDDHDTLAAAYKAAALNTRIHVLPYPLKPGVKPSKPKQLNYAFHKIKDNGFTVIGVIDAEDTVSKELLRHIDTAFNDQSVGIVQGGVQLMNHDSSWYSLHNVLEYYRWYSSSMAFQAANQFMPLGGNTVFIRTELLRKADGWPDTLTEDCSLGILLSTRLKAKTAVYYEPHLATREETPDSLKSLFNQRIRWHQGFFHEWRRSIWRELPGIRQRLIALYVLLTPMLLALFGLCLPIALVGILFLKSPVYLALLMYLPFIPMILLLVLNAVFLRDFGHSYGRPILLKHYFILFITFPLYQLVLNAASFWSIVRELRGDSTWYKTPHSGKHRLASAGLVRGGLNEG